MNLKTYLPKVSELMRDYDLLKEKFLEKKERDNELFRGNESVIDSLRGAVQAQTFKFNQV